MLILPFVREAVPRRDSDPAPGQRRVSRSARYGCDRSAEITRHQRGYPAVEELVMFLVRPAQRPLEYETDLLGHPPRGDVAHVRAPLDALQRERLEAPAT